jgi:NAD+ synthase
MDAKAAYKKLIKGIRAYFKKSNAKRAVIGLSGGIDSALSARLVADAIGKKNVHALIMPLKGVSSEENVKDTISFCKSLGISYSLIYINDFMRPFHKLAWKQNKIAKMNTASRIRAVILYNYANAHNALVIGTSNKTEIMLGYFTKYGDGAVDIEVIGDLFKTDEIELARFLKIPERIINKVPTAELYHGQTDEKELGAPYGVLDDILKSLNKKSNAVKKYGRELVNRVLEMAAKTNHKRKSPPVVKLS